jgi:hypothetical protein
VDLGSSLDAEEQTAMHDALHYVLTTVPSGAHLYFGICQDLRVTDKLQYFLPNPGAGD